MSRPKTCSTARSSVTGSTEHSIEIRIVNYHKARKKIINESESSSHARIRSPANYIKISPPRPPSNSNSTIRRSGVCDAPPEPATIPSGAVDALALSITIGRTVFINSSSSSGTGDKSSDDDGGGESETHRS